MEPAALQAHLLSLFERGQYTDVVIRIFGKTFKVHRVRTLTFFLLATIFSAAAVEGNPAPMQ
jgi:hypothetical protein